MQRVVFLPSIILAFVVSSASNVIRVKTITFSSADSLEITADEYIVSSKMRAVMKAARDDLLASGIDFDIADDRNFVAEAYLPIFERDIAGILQAMAR